MSLNPNLDGKAVPILETSKVKDEVLKVKVSNIEFEIKIEANNPKSNLLKASGTLYLTNMHLYLIN